MPTKGILYYSANDISIKLAKICRKHISNSGLPITSVTLKPTYFGNNICLNLKKGYITMFTQILTGLEAMKEDIVYFCEHDVLYHPSHFEFTLEKKDVFYYNGNYYQLRLKDGFAVKYNLSPLSGLVAYREALVIHFRERLEYIKQNGYSTTVGFEPMTHHRIPWKTWYNFELFNPEFPNIDIDHSGNATHKRYDINEFRRKPKFWEESNYKKIPGWKELPDIMNYLWSKSLSILIPAKNEEFLKKTCENILENIEGNTEIVVVLDGYQTELPSDPRLKIIYNKESIGQRAATNQACKMSNSRYIMKVDAHCSFDKGFDVKMMDKMQDNWTMVPVMKNLWVFDWVCPDGHRRYQSPSGPCNICGKETVKDIKWIGKNNPQSVSYCFDEEPHFQYFRDFKKRNEYKELLKTGLTESMSLQGSCFMVTREKYWELNLCDESLGSWGSQGIEVACKTWLSGGRVIINHNTWYAHMFRTQGKDFGFPYKQSQEKINFAKKSVRELFFDNKWDKQIYPLFWLIEKFWPVPGWSEEMRNEIKAWPLPKPLSVGIIYYTDNLLEENLANKVREQIKNSIGDYKLVSVSLNKPIDFGHNIVVNGEKSELTMFKQILIGLEALDTDIVFFCEHDTFYNKSHFEFRPARKDTYYYNMNIWRVRKSDGFAVKYDHKALSQICAYREKLISEFKERVRRVEAEGFHRNGFEPGTRKIKHGGFSDDRSEGWNSKYPNIDIRHETNLSASKWKPEDFKSQRNCRNWQESYLNKIPSWENLTI